MGDSESITREMCTIHRELIDTKLAACNGRVDGILEEIKGVRELQKNIMRTLILIAAGVACTLAGVILGRGFDFWWLVPK